jgi:hypothetical protein
MSEPRPNPVPGVGHFNRTLLGHFWRAAKGTGYRQKEEKTTEDFQHWHHLSSFLCVYLIKKSFLMPAP